MRKNSNIVWLMPIAAIILIIILLVLTIQDGNRLLNRNQEKDEVPYYSQENGYGNDEDE